MSNFKFVDELPQREGYKRGPGPKYIDFANALRANPGKWAEFPVQPDDPRLRASRAGAIRTGRYAGLPKDEFETVCRNKVIYVRYVGEDK